MTASLVASLNASVSVLLQDDSSALGTADFNSKSRADLGFNSDSSVGPDVVATKVYMARRVIADGATDSVDLAGSLTDPLGNPVVFSHIYAIYIRARDVNTTNLTIGGGTNAWEGPLGATGTTVMSAGDFLSFAKKTGWAVVASTGDILKVVNGSGAQAKYDLVVIGD